MSEFEAVDLRHGDYRRVMADVTCDLVCVDAPYSARTHTAYRDQSELRRRPISYDSWSERDVNEFVEFWAQRNRGWFISITDHNLAPAWEAAFNEAGLYTFSPIACVEPGSRVRQTGDGPAQWTCQAVVARPRTPKFVGWGALPGAYVVPSGASRTRDAGQHHIGGKPLWLMRELVRDYSRPGDVVCDPCAGGSTTLIAAAIEGRTAIGCEQSYATCEFASGRIEREYTHTMWNPRRLKGKQEKLFAREVA